MAAKKLWKNDYFKTLVAIILIISVVLGFFYGLQIGLHTSYPALTVISGSMSIPYGASDNNFMLSVTHPFDRTLSVGDIVIVEGINPKDLNTNYPNSDIIIFKSPIDGELIVHRIIGEKTVNGVMYFQTKGDGNGDPWPGSPTSGLDPWDYNNPPGVPQSDIVGKVVMRIPWFGWITMAMRDNSWGLPVIIGLIMVLVIVEFVVPILREKKPVQQSTPQT
jgi:signal peptidase I